MLKTISCTFVLMSLSATMLSTSSGVAVARSSAKNSATPKLEILTLPKMKQAFAGINYPRKSQWLGLYCNAQGAELKNVTMLSSPTQVDSYGQGKVPAQLLEIKGVELPICLLKGLRNGSAGNVSTYYFNGTKSKRSQNASRTDFRIKINANAKAQYVIAPVKSGESVSYTLRLGSQSQVLKKLEISPIVGESGLPTQAQSVLWAGDLDSDGKVDFVTAFSERAGEEIAIQLYLSSKAKKGDMVGLAAEFNYWPPDNPGC